MIAFRTGTLGAHALRRHHEGPYPGNRRRGELAARARRRVHFFGNDPVAAWRGTLSKAGRIG